MYGLIKRAYNQFMRLGIDIIFRMKTIETKKKPMMCELWLHIIQYYKKECCCYRVTKKGLIPYLHQMKSSKEVASVNEDNLV